MRALVLTDGGLRFDPSYPDPKPKKNEAIVRVTKAGICGTDLELVKGYKGFRGVPGHEFVGVVEWCGRNRMLVGRRVVGEINVGCGKCDLCLRGGGRHCAQREVIGLVGRDGAFAERLSIPARNLHALPDVVPTDAAVLVEPLAASSRIMEQVDVRARTRVVVFGKGRLGRLVALVLARRSEDVTLVGRSDPAPAPADLVVDATGSPEGFARAVDATRPLGTIVLKSTSAGDEPIPSSLLTKIVVNELKVVGSRCGWNDHFEAAITSLVLSPDELTPFIEATYRLEDFARAFEHAARPGALKILLDAAP